MIDLREESIQFLQRFLRRKYRKEIVAVRDPFADMARLLPSAEIHTVVDAGAFEGEVSKRMASMFPSAHIYAFEPASQAYARLTAHVGEINRVHPVHAALSSSSGKRTLYINAQDSTNALSPVAPAGVTYQSWQTKNLGKETVSVTTLDAWARKNGDVLPEVIKLDLQGHELEALKGAARLLQRSVLLIYTEVEFVRIYRENCLLWELEEYLVSKGFHLYQLYNITTGDDGQIVCADAIFCSNKPGRWITGPAA